MLNACKERGVARMISSDTSVRGGLKIGQDRKQMQCTYQPVMQTRGSRYLIIQELGLKDHDYYGFWGLSP